MFWQNNKKFDLLTSVLRFSIFSENGSKANFPQMFIWIHDKYSSTSYKECLWHEKLFFSYLFSRSITWEYWRLKGATGVTRGYKGLQGVTVGDKGLQEVTGGLQRIIESFFQLERSQILFLGLFCIKFKVEEILNFWPKPWTNPFGKILISKPVFSLFRNACFPYKMEKF